VFQQVRGGKIKEYDERAFQKRGIAYFQTDKLIIYNPDGAPLHIDGDPSHSSKKFMIEVIPDAFKLIQPL
jgi:diacylglycerol kinase family enzyme